MTTRPALQPIEPMEARIVDVLPEDDGWQFEPKWDGFRCIAARTGDAVALFAKSGKPLGRYFPEVVAMIAGLPAEHFVLDGELVIASGGELSFDALQMRLHPAESRVRKLAAETPALFVVFDILSNAKSDDLTALPLERRRAELEAFVEPIKVAGLRLSPFTRDRKEAVKWLARTGGALDGVIAKRVDGPYLKGERAMLKVKRMRSADCVVGGFRYGTGSKEVGSLLLGLYDTNGHLNHVGFTSGIAKVNKLSLTKQLEKLIHEPGFTGRRTQPVFD